MGQRKARGDFMKKKLFLALALPFMALSLVGCDNINAKGTLSDNQTLTIFLDGNSVGYYVPTEYRTIRYDITTKKAKVIQIEKYPQNPSSNNTQTLVYCGNISYIIATK